MATNPIRTAFPNLFTMLTGSSLEADAANAVAWAQEGDDTLRTALEEKLFTLNELMWLLAGAADPNLDDPAGRALEADLTAIIRVLGPDLVRTAYRDKLLVNDRHTLEDTQYELAATARACALLDTGSVRLEKPIPDPKKKPKDWKNTDVYGTFRGQPLRIEVTVLHESLPPAVQLELDELVTAAEVASGFSLNLRYVLADRGHAERVRALVELLYECHVASGGADVEIDGMRFEWRAGAYHCAQTSSPITSVVFYSSDEFAGTDQRREVIHPCTVRNLTPQYIFEDYVKPPGVVTLADLPDTPRNTPTSTKVHQMLAGKLLQCEPGVVNVVAYGTPLPMSDRDLEDALFGVGMVVFESASGSFRRDAKAPFVPAGRLANDDDRREFVEPFRKMSAVWHIRLGSHARSRFLLNPNAALPVPTDLARALSDPPPTEDGGTAFEAAGDAGTQGAARPPAPASPEPDEVMVWAEMAESFVIACGSLEGAKRELETLAASAVPLDELRSRLDQTWTGQHGEGKKMRFVSPSNAELATQFVVDCGGYEQATACMDAYAAERSEGPAEPQE